MPSPVQLPLRLRSYLSVAGSSLARTMLFELPRSDVSESIVARGKVFVQLRRTHALAKTRARVKDGSESPAKNVLRKEVMF
jgi:hypothetical protein